MHGSIDDEKPLGLAKDRLARALLILETAALPGELEIPNGDGGRYSISAVRSWRGGGRTPTHEVVDWVARKLAAMMRSETADVLAWLYGWGNWDF